VQLMDENIFCSILRFDPKDGASMFLRIVGELLSNCMEDITL
jgi:hypothetical protein